MRKIIDQILKGNFNYENGSLDFSCAKLEVNISAGSTYEGSFHVRSTPGSLTDGFINTTDLRMECLTPRFSGSDEEISFCFHGEDMEEGEIVKGAFNVISNHGEYSLPFVICVEHTILDSSIGTIKNLFHFTNLAKSNWQEAVALFYTPKFASIFTGSDAKVYDVYRGLSACHGNEQNVEEFLIQINKKQKLEFLVEELQIALEMVTTEHSYQVLEQELTIVRNGWGFTSLNVECDGNFVFAEKELLTDDDFLGNHCRLPIFIDSSLCRQGKNFGQVVLYDSHTCLTIPVTVKVGEKGKKEHTRLARRRITVQLMEFYQAFRMKKISSATWMKETGKLVDKLVAIDENDVSARLFQAQLLISQERYNEAEWLLNHAVSLLEQNKEEYETLLAYYYYLTTLIHRDEEYVNQMADKVERIYRRNRSDWRVAWLLLYLSEEYSKSSSEKWLFLEKQFYYGCTSPILYIEALFLLDNNPALLRRLDSFEMQVLYYAVRQQALGAELAEQVLYLAGRVKEYSSILLQILTFIYEKKKDVRVLQEICTLLIKGCRTDYQYFHWYQKGVEAQIRITNLYEYYMMSLDLSASQELPKILLRYFSYQNNLDYEHSAYLYSYLVRHQEEFPDLYESFQIRIERFMIDQMQKLHINANMAELYQSLLIPGMITKETAEALASLLFAHEVQVKDSRLRKVIVYQEGNLNPREYPLQDGIAWVSLYGSDDTILFEDRHGNRFVKSVEYTLKRLMTPGKFLRMIIPFYQNSLELDLYLCEAEHYEVKAENVERALRVAASENVAENIRRELYLKVLQYYYDADDMRALDDYLERIPFEMLRPEERSSVLRYMVLRGKYQTAFNWLQQYGPYFVEPKVLVRLTSEIIKQTNMVEDDTLTASALYSFRKGKYDGVILSYLTMYFEGMTKDMRDIWKAARSFEIDCYMISENIIVQMLYSGAFVGEKMDIFRYYVSQGAKQEVEEAFLEQCCYDCFVKERLTDAYVFQEIRHSYLRGEEIRFVCKLAFLKYFAENKEELSKEEMPLVEDFLSEMMERGIHLNFFRDLKECAYLTRKMTDKTIIEYRARPEGKADIHYVVMNENGEADEYLCEPMKDVYGGVCFKEFILFFGESIQYYITETNCGEEQLTESGNLQKSDIVGEAHGSRYELINDIIISKTLQDYDTLDDLMQDYFYKEFWNHELFRLL